MNKRVQKSIFFGIGLCTSKKPAIAVPFDILSFFLTAENIRRFTPELQVIILIADIHADTNSFMTPVLIKKAKNRVNAIIERIISKLSLTNFNILPGSQIATLPSFKNILSHLPPLENAYLKQEIADVLWLSRHEGLVAKLGWSLNNKPNTTGHDERFFDQEIQPFLDRPIQFIHLEAGRTLDPTKPKASPYISVAGEKRVLLTLNEPVTRKLIGAPKDTLVHLVKIVTLFEKLFGSIKASNLETKVQFIIDKIML